MNKIRSLDQNNQAPAKTSRGRRHGHESGDSIGDALDDAYDRGFTAALHHVQFLLDQLRASRGPTPGEVAPTGDGQCELARPQSALDISTDHGAT